MTKRKPKSRSGPNLSEDERGTLRVQTRVPRAVREAYEREAERRGVTLGALVRTTLEGAPWVPGETQKAPAETEAEVTT